MVIEKFKKTALGQKIRNTLLTIKFKYNEHYFPYERYQKKLNCLFIHIPKNAGTSVLTALGKTDMVRRHFPWYVYQQANPFYFKNAYKFAFVRNPWDRTYSAYEYLVNGGNKNRDLATSTLIRSYNSFESFVCDGLGNGHFRSHILFIPQSEFIIGPEGQNMADFIGRCENIEHDFQRVADLLGRVSALPKRNVGNRKEFDYISAYKNDRMIDIVSQIYAQDINSFGYHFDRAVGAISVA